MTDLPFPWFNEEYLIAGHWLIPIQLIYGMVGIYINIWLNGSGNCTPFGSHAPQFQRSGMVRHTITFRTSDFRSPANIDFEPMEAEDRSEGPSFVLQAFLWSSLPKYLKRLHLADCQITDSQVTTLVRALETHEVIEVSIRSLIVHEAFTIQVTTSLILSFSNCNMLYLWTNRYLTCMRIKFHHLGLVRYFLGWRYVWL